MPSASAAIVGRQEAHAEVGLAEAPAGIDAGPQREAELPAVAQLGHPGGPGERSQARRLAPPGDLQALADEGAVEALERHHIAHGGERHEVEPAQKIGHPPALAPAAQLASGGDEEKKGDPDRGQVAYRARLVEPVRVDHRQRLGQLRLGRVVVDDDDLLTGGSAVRQRREGRGAVVEAEDQAAAGQGQPVEGRGTGAIAVDQAVGDENDRVDPEAAGEADEKRRRGGAVDVVVADDAEALARCQRVGEPRRRPIEIEEMGRIGQPVAQPRLEKARHGVEAEPAAGEEPADQLAQPVTLADRQRRLGGRLGKPPGTPGDGAVDPHAPRTMAGLSG